MIKADCFHPPKPPEKNSKRLHACGWAPQLASFRNFRITTVLASRYPNEGMAKSHWRGKISTFGWLHDSLPTQTVERKVISKGFEDPWSMLVFGSVVYFFYVRVFWLQFFIVCPEKTRARWLFLRTLYTFQVNPPLNTILPLQSGPVPVFSSDLYISMYTKI